MRKLKSDCCLGIDAQGRRKARTVGAATTVYVTDADNREVLEYDGTTGAVRAWYAYGLGSGEPLNRMDVSAGSRQTLIPDAQGSIVSRLDSASGMLTTAGYGAYGENPAQTTAGPGYTAQRHDPETQPSTAEASGLYYYRARMYSPTLGRFLQPDPTGTSGSGTNLYAYVGNDPINRTDPSGNDEVDAEAAFVTQTVFQACGTNYDCQMRLSAPGTAMAAGSVAPLALAVAPEMLEAATAFGGGKALLGFGLGYGGAYLGGTKSEGGRLLAGGVGAFAVPGTASLITTTADLGYAGWGTFGIGAVGAFGGTFLGDLGAQGGDYINGVSQKISISNAVEAGAIGAIAYTGFGEGALAAKALEIPGFAGFAVDTVSGADSLLAGFGLDKLLGGASGGSNGTVKPGK